MVGGPGPTVQYCIDGKIPRQAAKGSVIRQSLEVVYVELPSILWISSFVVATERPDVHPVRNSVT